MVRVRLRRPGAVQHAMHAIGKQDHVALIVERFRKPVHQFVVAMEKVL